MKAPSFAYAKPRSLAEAFDLLERPGAKILAGGQSLIPSLNLRLSAPELLVDITAVKGLSGIEVANGMVRIGALLSVAGLAVLIVLLKRHEGKRRRTASAGGAV